MSPVDWWQCEAVHWYYRVRCIRDYDHDGQHMAEVQDTNPASNPKRVLWA